MIHKKCTSQGVIGILACKRLREIFYQILLVSKPSKRPLPSNFKRLFTFFRGIFYFIARNLLFCSQFWQVQLNSVRKLSFFRSFVLCNLLFLSRFQTYFMLCNSKHAFIRFTQKLCHCGNAVLKNWLRVSTKSYQNKLK